MRLAVIAFAAGVWLLQRQAGLPGGGGLAAMAIATGLAVAGSVAIAHGVRSGGAMTAVATPLRIGALVLACGLLGFLWAALWAHGRVAGRLGPAWEGRDVEITGGIAGLPEPFERGVRFQFDIESVGPAEARPPQRVLLAWDNGLTREEFQEVAPVRAGEA